jgi:hypothetical protein
MEVLFIIVIYRGANAFFTKSMGAVREEEVREVVIVQLL